MNEILKGRKHVGPCTANRTWPLGGVRVSGFAEPGVGKLKAFFRTANRTGIRCGKLFGLKRSDDMCSALTKRMCDLRHLNALNVLYILFSSCASAFRTICFL